jgi:hypothetical protein
VSAAAPVVCPCGCGRTVRVGNRYAALGCSLVAMRADPARRARWHAASRLALLERRIDRWASPAWARIEAQLVADGVALTRRQAAVIRYELAEVVRRAAKCAYNTQFQAAKRPGRLETR